MAIIGSPQRIIVPWRIIWLQHVQRERKEVTGIVSVDLGDDGQDHGVCPSSHGHF
jgi:hypothetical protein